jgi:triosephosphate isomerase
MGAMRRQVAGTGWKMNFDSAATRAYAVGLLTELTSFSHSQTEIFVLPPFTSLHKANSAFAGSCVAIGGQNMHWEPSGAWTGEVSAPMLADAGCRYVELAHSERLQHFGETYDLVRLKVNAAFAHDLVPILCIGEMVDEKKAGRTDAVLEYQVLTALADQNVDTVSTAILAYEPRWAIGANDAAKPAYVSERHAHIRSVIAKRFGAAAASTVRIVYGGSVNQQNGAALAALEDVDGLFVGRAAWTPMGFAEIIRIVSHAAAAKETI